MLRTDKKDEDEDEDDDYDDDDVINTVYTCQYFVPS
jgi:hypothetical protein